MRLGLLTALFFVVAAGTGTLLIPYLLTRWEPHTWGAASLPASIVGVVLIVIGFGGVLDSFRRFVVEGRGTPAPVLPPKELVVRGLFRYTRNPIYVFILGVVTGEALLLHRYILLGYAVVLWLGFHIWVVIYEEPTLFRTFGESYAAYKRAVPRWWPRL